jgi:acid phosphatase
MGTVISQFARNISNSTTSFHGDLRFLQRWKMEEWIYLPGEQFNQETLTGPAAGSVTMFNLGTELRSLYPGLWNYTSHGGRRSTRRRRVWSSPSQRVIDSAKYFALGFYGKDEFDVQVIPETTIGGNTLTPS